MGHPYTYKVSDVKKYYKREIKKHRGENMQQDLPHVLVQDDVFPWIDNLSRWAREKAEFSLHKAGGSGFEVARLPERLSEAMCDRTSVLLKTPLKIRYSFLRLSTEEIDINMRIHTDTGIGSQWACLAYLSDPPDPLNKLDSDGQVMPYGTAFWRHEKYGRSWLLPYEVDGKVTDFNKEEHNRLIVDDSKDESKWSIDNFVSVRKNRMLIYPTSIFHSRYPWKGWGKDQADGRIIWMMFFDKEKKNGKYK